MLASRILSFLPTSLINSIIYEHSRKIHYFFIWFGMKWSLWTGRWSLFTGGLYSEVVYMEFLDRRNLQWSLKKDCIYSQLVFNTDWTVYQATEVPFCIKLLQCGSTPKVCNPLRAQKSWCNPRHHSHRHQARDACPNNTKSWLPLPSHLSWHGPWNIIARGIR